jgi:phenylacetate-CoA ligase
LESLWPGARIFDHHGMTEVGPVTYECPQQSGVLHVIESAYFAEVIDPVTGQAAASGELVLTTLTRTGSPLLRYRTGDLVKRGPGQGQCVCGRHDLTLGGGILGRVDDMIIVRGVNVYPSAVEAMIRACGGVAEYQVRLRQGGGMTEMTVVIEPIEEGGLTDAEGQAQAQAQELARRLEQMMSQTLSLRVPVKLAGRGELPRFDMKARRWVRES